MRLTVPLLLTFGRIVVIPLVVVLLLLREPWADHVATVLFGLAAITDWLDGRLARRWNQTTRFGAFLDPVADKLLVAVSLVMLLYAHPTAPLAALVAIIIGREITISALREWLAEIGQRFRVAVNYIGKFKTAAQMLAIGFMMWGTPVGRFAPWSAGYVLLFIAAVLTLWSMTVYLRAAWPYMHAESRSPGDPS
ncbi:MAG: CDP-diacylglycerol--glycerol-3-phosphate 3-phosphatidyltransferase [Nevskiaceae bacterium]|nr:MAG: CDP-diacylglycerol--glycerol-3-phosphate 3-phosphatidyltransferase [Nevskiaceae bacterium]TBR74090.1 MAG: CDP-diacylglycerol--glycerol-3-phosphate 3-phosphatidyltransferase [Nevskiaceae bacterium]